MTLLKLFWSFLQVGLFSIGGGYAAMPVIQSRVVDGYGWMSMQEFADLITIAEMTPGPIAVNASTFVGMRMAGFAGAIAATLGCILPSLALVSALSRLYERYGRLPALQSILGCLRPAVVALIASAGLGILRQVLFGGTVAACAHVRWEGLAMFLIAFAVLRKTHASPIAVMLLCGASALGMGLLKGGCGV